MSFKCATVTCYLKSSIGASCLVSSLPGTMDKDERSLFPLSFCSLSFW